MKKMSKELKDFLMNEVDFVFDSNEGCEDVMIGDIIEIDENEKVVIRIHKK